jgi:hypothetical protein
MFSEILLVRLMDRSPVFVSASLISQIWQPKNPQSSDSPLRTKACFQVSDRHDRSKEKREQHRLKVRFVYSTPCECDGGINKIKNGECNLKLDLDLEIGMLGNHYTAGSVSIDSMENLVRAKGLGRRPRLQLFVVRMVCEHFDRPVSIRDCGQGRSVDIF